MKHAFLSTLVGLVLAAPLSAQELKIPFEKYKLPNGLEVILSEDHRLPLVTVNVWYHVGAVNEQPGKTGFAHLFEHIMFQGSKHIGEDQHFEYLQKAGATNVNGTTNNDRTNYFETVPSNQLELALWLESDRLAFLLDTLNEERFKGQQGVVKNERRQRTDNVPYGTAYEKIAQALYPAPHPYYGNVIGSLADLDAASLDDVKNFFRAYYHPRNATIAIVGDFDPKNAKALIEKYFGPVVEGPAVKPIELKTPKVTSEIKLPNLQDNVTLSRIYFGWITPAYYKPGDAEADLLARVLAGGKSSRLYKRLVYTEKIAQDVAAFQSSMGQSSLFMIYATAKPTTTPEQLQKAIDEELDKLRKELISEDELNRAKRAFSSSAFKLLESQAQKADILQGYNHYLGDPGKLAFDIERYTKATADDMQKFVNTYLTTSSRATLIVEPKKQ
jgi:zinc protease